MILRSFIDQYPLDSLLLGRGNVLTDKLFCSLVHQDVTDESIIRRHHYQQFIPTERVHKERGLIIGEFMKGGDNIDRQLIFPPMEPIIEFPRVREVLTVLFITNFAVLDNMIENDLFKLTRNIG